MPLSPSPLLPGHSPLPRLGERPADRRALRVGALVAIITLLVVLVPGDLLQTRLVFLAPGLLAHAVDDQGALGASGFQGFSFVWTRRSTGQGGYTSAASLANLRSEAASYHMNTVVIPVVADMPGRDDSVLDWHPTDQYAQLDMLSDADYIQAISDARKAGLEPILELVVKQQDIQSEGSQDARYVGEEWYNQTSAQTLYINGSVSVGTLEHSWIDNYSAFAVHFAQLSQAQHLRYFIFGDGLANVTTDSPNSTASADPQGLVRAAGDDFDASKCAGRHECEWRHVVHALRAPTYSTYMGQKALIGANYTGKLIYAASWAPADGSQGAAPGEFEAITWWNAIDAIGIDAGFPLTQTDADDAAATLVQAWHGKGTGLKGQGDIYSRIGRVADKSNKLVVFTAAGYQSTPQSNTNPGQTDPNGYDPNEQLNDMQALVQTFTGTPWWAGVIWSYDQPVSPRSSQPLWQFGTQWAGDNLQPFSDSNPKGTKLAGIWLASYYHKQPVPCLC